VIQNKAPCETSASGDSPIERWASSDEGDPLPLRGACRNRHQGNQKRHEALSNWALNSCAAPTYAGLARCKSEVQSSCDCHCRQADYRRGCRCTWREADWPSSAETNLELYHSNCHPPTAGDWRHARVPKARYSTGDYFQSLGERDRSRSRCPAHSSYECGRRAACCWSLKNPSVNLAYSPKGDDSLRVVLAGSCWERTNR
jgi:hypothetical protein